MYDANEDRYDSMIYRRAGRSGLVLSAFSLGFWHNFGAKGDYAEMKRMVYTAFDNGIMSFYLANNYGPPGGEAEKNFGAILNEGLKAYRDEIVISTKAGYQMWPGPLGKGGGKKHLLASLDQSLKRMNLDYVDIYYHHCPDPETPLEETVEALSEAVRSGRTRYVALSKYNARDVRRAYELFRQYNIRPVLDQVRYSILDRSFDSDNLFTVLDELGMGSAVFSPLAQGLLSDKYLNGIPANSRANTKRTLSAKDLTPELLAKIRALNGIAAERGQTLAQMAIAWNLRVPELTSALIGASSSGQIREIAGCLKHSEFSGEELRRIDEILNS